VKVIGIRIDEFEGVSKLLYPLRRIDEIQVDGSWELLFGHG
jgi:hypothetical protein